MGFREHSCESSSRTFTQETQFANKNCIQQLQIFYKEIFSQQGCQCLIMKSKCDEQCEERESVSLIVWPC